MGIASRSQYLLTFPGGTGADERGELVFPLHSDSSRGRYRYHVLTRERVGVLFILWKNYILPETDGTRVGEAKKPVR